MRVSARHYLTLSVPALVLAVASLACSVPAAHAQGMIGVLRDSKTSATPTSKPNMVLKARELQYDQDNDTVTAIGGVQIYYDGRALQADRVIYDRKTQRVRSSGNVVITEADGTVTYADNFDLTQDYKNGFINALKMLSPDQTRLASNRAERSGNGTTTFQQGVYTACVPCKENPEKPPEWQVKAAKVIHNEQEKMIYFEDAFLEVFGVPVFYAPYLSTPDPTVKRKSGFLIPTYYTSSQLGFGTSLPYFINLAPNYDMTITPGFTTRQGPNAQVEWRHRLLNGSYTIEASGTYQADPSSFIADGIGKPSYRGSIRSNGLFYLNDYWRWGWDLNLPGDKYYWRDYMVPNLKDYSSATSSIYLSGGHNKSYFDIRSYYFKGLLPQDAQRKLPVAAPVIDYGYVVDRPVYGGEAGWNVNFANINRQDAAFTAMTGSRCDRVIEPVTRARCLQRGIAGNYTRGSINSYWKKTFTDSIGEQWTPFAYIRGDIAYTSLDKNEPDQFVKQGTAARFVPAVGLDYRYPFFAETGWGTHVLEPVAQVILRPKAAQSGEFPNEDAQSLIFDDANLFRWDKFTGYDRAEDGSRFTAGLQYTFKTSGGGYYNAMFGRSVSMFGYNQFRKGDIANTGLQSGLDTTLSDYVGRIYLQPINNFAILTDARFDTDNGAIRQIEAGGVGTIGRIKADITYARYDAQPLLGLNTRKGINGKTSIKLSENWITSASALYDLNQSRFSSNTLAVTYVDTCVALGVSMQRSYNASTKKTDSTFQLQLSLRGLGATGTPEQFAYKQWAADFTNPNAAGMTPYTNPDGLIVAE